MSEDCIPPLFRVSSIRSNAPGASAYSACSVGLALDSSAHGEHSWTNDAHETLHSSNDPPPAEESRCSVFGTRDIDHKASHCCGLGVHSVIKNCKPNVTNMQSDFSLFNRIPLTLKVHAQARPLSAPFSASDSDAPVLM